jgi:hypothetical protein
MKDHMALNVLDLVRGNTNEANFIGFVTQCRLGNNSAVVVNFDVNEH